MKRLRQGGVDEERAATCDVVRRLQKAGFDTYIAEWTYRHRGRPERKAGVKRAIVERNQNLFPGYIFVEVGAGCAHATVCDTPGVIDFVRIDGQPAIVPARLISWFHTAIAAGCFVYDERTGWPTYVRPGAQKRGGAADEDRYVIGQMVKVIEGPFEGFWGEVTAVHAGRERIKALIGMFGRETPVELEYGQVDA